MPCSARCVMSPCSLINFCQIKTRAPSPAWDTGMCNANMECYQEDCRGNLYTGFKWLPRKLMALPAEGAARRGSILVLFLEGWPSPPALPFPYRQSIHPLLPRLTTALQLPCTIIATPPNLGFLTCKLDLLVCVHACCCVQLFVTPWTVAHQAPLFMGFFRQEYWSGLLFPPPGDLPNSNSHLLCLLHQQADSLPFEPLGKPKSPSTKRFSIMVRS